LNRERDLAYTKRDCLAVNSDGKRLIPPEGSDPPLEDGTVGPRVAWVRDGDRARVWAMCVDELYRRVVIVKVNPYPDEGIANQV
jgi:hypothetical protein